MVFDLFRTKQAVPTEVKASAAQPLVAFHGNGRAAWSPRDINSLMRNGFAGNPVGFRCVKMVAEAAAAVPLILQDGTTRFDTHPILDLLRRPNETQSFPELLEAFYGQLLLSGNGYLEAAGVSEEQATPQQIYVLRSDRMRVVPGRDGWPVGFEYCVGSRKHRFNISGLNSPILHLKSFHPQDDHYGFSPLQAAASAIDVHTSASRWSKSLLDNAARPSGAIVYKGAEGHGTMANDQYDRLVDELETNHQGARNAGRPMLLEGGLDWKPMGFSPSDMEFQKTKDTAAREIALAFGVPPMLLGLPGDNTYANYQEANRAFYRLTVLPLVNRVAGGLSNWLPGWFGDNAEIKPDLDGIPALALERDAHWSRIASAEFLTASEKRRMLGLPALAEDE